MSDALSQVLAAVSGLGLRLGAMDQRLEAMEKRFDSLTEEVTRLRVDVMGRLDRHQNLLTQIKDDMQVNIAASDDTRDKLRSFQNEQHNLTHQVSIIHRRLLQLEQRFDAKEGGS